MPRYTLTIRSADLEKARRLCFAVPEVEGACFLLCGESRTTSETRLICHQVIPVEENAYLQREPDYLSLDSSSYVNAAKQAREKNFSLVFVHSHPGGLLEFSEQDDREEPKLQEFFAARIPNRIHGALILTEAEMVGRVWDKGFVSMDCVRVIGDRFNFHFGQGVGNAFPEYFDRQVRAFGPDIQAVLSRLHIGIVGLGGTGSAVAEQLIRLGIGTLSFFDRDIFEPSNVNRVYGAGTDDSTMLKVKIAERNSQRIGVGTKLNVYPQHITDKDAALALRDCDLIFGCTDKEAPRAILTQLSLRYLIPFFDLGVLVNSKDGRLIDVVGRVTTFFPGVACLFCRGRINSKRISFEMLPEEERLQRIAEGYAPELASPSPAVVPFTTQVAAWAVTEFLQRLTGFMGAQRQSTEVLVLFDQSRMRTSREDCDANCFCTDQELWGSGDSERFLGLWG